MSMDEWIMYERRCIWEVTCISPDDGREVIVGHFTQKARAEEARMAVCPSLKSHSRQVSLWKDGDDHWYKVERTEVFVDVPGRQAVLAKLSPAERKALGI